MHMAVERLLPAVAHLHRAPGAQGEHARVDLHADVLAGAERAAHSREVKTHLLRREVEAGGELLEIGMQPLGGDEKLDTAVLRRNGQSGLRAERRLVLHAGLVHPLHPDIGPRTGIAVNNGQRAHDVALRMDRRRALF